MKLRVLFALLTVSFLFGFTLAYAEDGVTVMVNNVVVSGFEQPPVIIDDRTYLPVRAISEILDTDVQWNNSTETATITRGKKAIALKIGSHIMAVGDIVDSANDKNVEMDASPQLINNSTMLPIRVIIEQFGGKVMWDESSTTVIIIDDYKDKSKNNLCYHDFPMVPDFGQITAAPLTNSDVNDQNAFYTYNVANVTEEQMNDYMTAMNINGYAYDENLSNTLSNYFSKKNGSLLEVVGFFKDNNAVLLLFSNNDKNTFGVYVTSDYKSLSEGASNLDLEYEYKSIEVGQKVEPENMIDFSVEKMDVLTTDDGNRYFAVNMNISLSDNWSDDTCDMTDSDFVAVIPTDSGEYKTINATACYYDDELLEFPITLEKNYSYNVTLFYSIPDSISEIAFVATNTINNRIVGNAYAIIYNKQ